MSIPWPRRACREFALDSGPNLIDGFPAEVGSGAINDAANRTQIEIDVAVLAPEDPRKPRRVLSLGEAKWGETMGHRHLERLTRARELLARKGYDTDGTVLACYGGVGFTVELMAEAAENDHVMLIDLDRLYGR